LKIWIQSIALALLSQSIYIQAQGTNKANDYSLVVAELVEPAVRCWTDAYRQSHPEFKVSYLTTMNSQVVKSFIEGKTPIAPCAKEMSPQELNDFRAKWGYTPTRVAICMDALVALVNKNNPIKEIRIEQLDAMFSTSRKQGWPKDVETWGDLGLSGDNWNSCPIQLFGHPEGSGTRAFFKEAVELDGTAKADIHRGEDILQMIEALMANQAAIGYGSLSQTYDQLKALPLISRGGKSAVAPTPLNVANGSYPLGRVLYLYVNKRNGSPLESSLKSFLTFILSKEGQRCVLESGFVPLPEEMAHMGAHRLEN